MTLSWISRYIINDSKFLIIEENYIQFLWSSNSTENSDELVKIIFFFELFFSFRDINISDITMVLFIIRTPLHQYFILYFLYNNMFLCRSSVKYLLWFAVTLGRKNILTLYVRVNVYNFQLLCYIFISYIRRHIFFPCCRE